MAQKRVGSDPFEPVSVTESRTTDEAGAAGQHRPTGLLHGWVRILRGPIARATAYSVPMVGRPR